MKTILTFIIFTTSYFFIFTLQAEDRISLDKEAIIGNKESPKAIYIVPWRSLMPSGMQSLEISALLDEELEMIDPEVFKRQLELYEIVYSDQHN